MPFRPYFFFILLMLAAFLPGLSAQEIPAELMLRAYMHCYPEKTGEIIFLDGDWAIQAGKETYYWAGGRFLPAGLRDKAASYTPLIAEIYPDTMPSPQNYSARYIETLRITGSLEIAKNADDQHRGFQGALHGGITRKEIENNLQSIDFLGKKISVNKEIVPALKRIDTVIKQAATQDTPEGKSVAAFITSIGQIGGYNWREIRGSQRMSYHSWGLAVDIQPKRLGGKTIYWLWESSHNDNWMLVSPTARWNPPDMVIEAFEREGFIWGGKWAFYDNMHFEYRPELHELNRLIAAGEESYSYNINLRAAWQDLHHLYPDGLIK